MAHYVLSRLGSTLLVLALSSVGIVALLRLVPGDPVAILAGADSTPESRAAIRAELGLDQPFWEQYAGWLHGLVTFDLGPSYRLGGDVGDLVAAGALNTVVLTAAALLLASVGALLASVLAVLLDRPWLTALLSAGNTVAVAVPTFAISLLLVLAFAVYLPVLPAGGAPPDGFASRPDLAVQYLLLPAIALALPAWATLTRFLTEALYTQLRAPYVTTARALGIPRRRIVLTQALPNALPSAVTVLGLQVGTLLGGAILIEAVFAWPGLGRLVEQGISARDYPVVQVLLLLSVAVFVLTQLASDLIHAWLDPRIRLKGAH
ncbi:ABC transporter permease [Nocardioides insulae]|uniref:ABC transporter permease n=1 Tax=Nocardioides insulae TaxID=394734 RepID=UPI0003FDE89B|nr:ABC transporter permease [Nocardioides insulae]